MSTFAAHNIPGGHKDLIHDVAFDWYGDRMATCSSDQHVKIWDRDPANNTWVCTASWKSHCGSVWKVTWAHPEFGQIIATCSFDRTAAIWEEVAADTVGTRAGSDGGGGGGAVVPAGGGVGGGDHSSANWIKRTSLVDSRTSVTDVKFAPRHMGLMLATCSADGTVRIYEATDVMNLSEWSLMHEIPCKVPLSCISWNQTVARFHPPMIAVGSDSESGNGGSKVFVFEYHDGSRRWLKVETPYSGTTEPVHDIAFAPNLGRSYHVLAIASKELKILSMKPMGTPQQQLAKKSDESQATPTKYEIRLAGSYNDHDSTVWRSCWNVTGTILATSGDDGQVKLWKSNYLDQWRCVATLQGNGQQPETFPQSAAAIAAGAGAPPAAVAGIGHMATGGIRPSFGGGFQMTSS